MITETMAKYLAGLCDADGCLTLQLRKSSDGRKRCYLKLSLYAEDSVDRQGFVKSLPSLTGFGNVYRRDTERQNGCSWEISKIEHLNMLIPRLTKHMVIKAKHWQRLHQTFLSLRGKCLTDKDCEVLRAMSKQSRMNDAGPLKPKNHPTWAWVAGFMDGDGSYIHKQKTRTYLSRGKRKSCKYYVTRMQATLHGNDQVALDLLKKAFGGNIYEEGNLIKWVRNLGSRDSSFAKKFLAKVVGHSKIKRHKIESILSYHNQLQRLSDCKPTG